MTTIATTNLKLFAEALEYKIEHPNSHSFCTKCYWNSGPWVMKTCWGCKRPWAHVGINWSGNGSHPLAGIWLAHVKAATPKKKNPVNGAAPLTTIEKAILQRLQGIYKGFRDLMRGLGRTRDLYKDTPSWLTPELYQLKGKMRGGAATAQNPDAIAGNALDSPYLRIWDGTNGQMTTMENDDGKVVVQLPYTTFQVANGVKRSYCLKTEEVEVAPKDLETLLNECLAEWVIIVDKTVRLPLRWANKIKPVTIPEALSYRARWFAPRIVIIGADRIHPDTLAEISGHGEHVVRVAITSWRPYMLNNKPIAIVEVPKRGEGLPTYRLRTGDRQLKDCNPDGLPSLSTEPGRAQKGKQRAEIPGPSVTEVPPTKETDTSSESLKDEQGRSLGPLEPEVLKLTINTSSLPAPSQQSPSECSDTSDMSSNEKSLSEPVTPASDKIEIQPDDHILSKSTVSHRKAPSKPKETSLLELGFTFNPEAPWQSRNGMQSPLPREIPLFTTDYTASMYASEMTRLALVKEFGDQYTKPIRTGNPSHRQSPQTLAGQWVAETHPEAFKAIVDEAADYKKGCRPGSFPGVDWLHIKANIHKYT